MTVWDVTFQNGCSFNLLSLAPLRLHKIWALGYILISDQCTTTVFVYARLIEVAMGRLSRRPGPDIEPITGTVSLPVAVFSHSSCGNYILCVRRDAGTPEPHRLIMARKLSVDRFYRIGDGNVFIGVILLPISKKKYTDTHTHTNHINLH